MQFSSAFCCFSRSAALATARAALSSSSGTIVQCSADQCSVLYLLVCSLFVVCEKSSQIRLELPCSCIAIWHLVKQTTQSECFIKCNNNNKTLQLSNCIWNCVDIFCIFVCCRCTLLFVCLAYALIFIFIWLLDLHLQHTSCGCRSCLGRVVGGGRGCAHSAAWYVCCCRCQIYSQLKLPLMCQRAHSAFCELHRRRLSATKIETET